MPADYLHGEDCRCEIGLADSDTPTLFAYSIKKFMIKFKRPRLMSTNAQGKPGNRDRVETAAYAPGSTSAVAGSRSAELSIEEATLDWEAGQNLFSAPLLIGENSYLCVRIYPKGTGEDYHELWILVDEVSHEGEVGQLQPITFKGETDGAFKLVGE